MTRPDPPPGVYLQIYRGAIRGRTLDDRRDALARYCDQLAVMRGGGVVVAPVFHGFGEELRDAWPTLASLAAERSMLALASWGLDGRKLTARQKGDLAGQVLASPDCAAGLLDAEGQWDSDLGRADDMDEAGALALGDALRARAPDTPVGDQPWFAIEAHGDVRRTARPTAEGGVFRGFPVDEFATVTTWGRFRQAYIYNSRGAHYGPTFERMDREWAAVTPALRSAGLERPLRVTLQAYRWKLHELIHALLDRCVRPREPVVLWCDPWPDATTLAALRFVEILMREGFAAPGVDAREAVRLWQRSYNACAPSERQLSVDGWAGTASALAAGIAPPR